jgi:hypothetical protein
MVLRVSRVSRPPIYKGRMEVHIIVASLVTVLKGCNGIVSTDWQWSAGDGRYEDSKVGSEEGSRCPREGVPSLEEAFRDGPHAQYLSQHGHVLREMRERV